MEAPLATRPRQLGDMHLGQQLQKLWCKCVPKLLSGRNRWLGASYKETMGEVSASYPGPGEDHSSPWMCSKLETWPSGSSFESFQMNRFQGETGTWPVFSAPSVLILESACMPINSCSFVIGLWVSWIQASLAFRLRCFGGLLLRWQS